MSDKYVLAFRLGLIWFDFILKLVFFFLFFYSKKKKKGLKFQYEASIEDKKWSGTARIPEAYFPAKVTKWNAYAIHGSGEKRVYEALFPAEFGKYENPDFHRLELFKSIKFDQLLKSNWERNTESEIWTN